jgi:hypothetical protein
MKIRIKGNSVRYRLTQSEVTQLWEKGHWEEQTQFASKTFLYAIEIQHADDLSADFTDNRITLYMPKVMVDELHDTDKVGFDGWSGPVRLLIEKDFACIDNTEEDQSDHYPNPCQKTD